MRGMGKFSLPCAALFPAFQQPGLEPVVEQANKEYAEAEQAGSDEEVGRQEDTQRPEVETPGRCSQGRNRQQEQAGKGG